MNYVLSGDPCMYMRVEITGNRTYCVLHSHDVGHEKSAITLTCVDSMLAAVLTLICCGGCRQCSASLKSPF